MHYDVELSPSEGASGETLAYYAAYQRAALLLELLAEDHFPDQDAFDRWAQKQMRLVFPSAPRAPEDQPETGT